MYVRKRLSKKASITLYIGQKRDWIKKVQSTGIQEQEGTRKNPADYYVYRKKKELWKKGADYYAYKGKKRL